MALTDGSIVFIMDQEDVEVVMQDVQVEGNGIRKGVTEGEVKRWLMKEYGVEKRWVDGLQGKK